MELCEFGSSLSVSQVIGQQGVHFQKHYYRRRRRRRRLCTYVLCASVLTFSFFLMLLYSGALLWSVLLSLSFV